MTWRDLPDLASRTLGASVIAANDEFFADRENLIKPQSPECRPHTFTNKGQEYDGWETRRRRGEPGDHDWAIVALGVPGVVRGVIVDTAFFKGNYPPFVSVEACRTDGYPAPDQLSGWDTLVERSAARGHSVNEFEVDSSKRYTHVRLNIFPDGGVARLRVHGDVVADPRWLDDLPFDLVALANGGHVTECSDGFFSPPANMLRPGISRFMSDGWETARRRDDGHDWAVVRLAAEAVPTVAELDTTHYKGNSPDRVALEGAGPDGTWRPLLPETPVRPDTAHRFRLVAGHAVTQLRLHSYPDGGIGRFRLYGKLTAEGRTDLERRWTDTS